MKMIRFEVPDGLPQQKLVNYVLRAYPELPPYSIRNAFQKRDVKVDGVRCGKEAVLRGGSKVILYLPEEKEKKIPVLYQSDEILLIHKPSGIPCESSIPGERTLVDMMESQIRQKVWLCHRLDAPTEGMLVLALTESGREKMQEAFRRGDIEKEYICLVCGQMESNHEVLKAWVTKDAFHGEVHVKRHSSADAKEMITEYWVLESGEISRLRVRLYTGRTHQIRAHLASIGHPVLGDDRYGDRNINKQQRASKLKLCSVSLRFHTGDLFPDLDGKLFKTEPSF